MKLSLLLAFPFLLFGGFAAPSAAQRAAPVPVIFDTDISPDYDDVGALAMLHALADRGEARILATVASNRYEGVGPCINVLNTYFKRPNLPIGQPSAAAPDEKSHPNPWVDTLLAQFPHKVQKTSELPAAVSIYRRILAQQPDTSVVIITVGFLTNLSDLLQSRPDQVSSLNGTELVRRKVKRWVCMGGHFADPIGSRKEFNLERDWKSARYVFEHFPRPSIFSGFEIGYRIITGPELLRQSRPKNPVQTAFRVAAQVKGFENGRHSWDQTAVLVGVRGWQPNYTLRRGKVLPNDDPTYRWQDDPKGKQAFLVEKSSPETVRAEIEHLMMHQPR